MPRDTSVVLTGGEPLLQADRELTIALKNANIYIAVETSGSRTPELFYDYIAISPKVKEGTLIKNFKFADELRYVLEAGDHLPDPQVTHSEKFLSPMFEGEKMDKSNVDWCVQLAKEHAKEGWRVSMPIHKFMGIR